MPDVPADRADELVVSVDWVNYTGWQAVEVVRPLSAVSGRWSVSWADQRPWVIGPGTRVTLQVRNWEGSTRVLTGHCDQVAGNLTPDAHENSAAGRDVTGDLADATAMHEPGEWIAQPLERIVADLAAPFDIDVQLSGREPGDVFQLFRVQPGETAWAAIERAARMRGKLAYTTGDGALQITDPGDGYADAELVEGQNVRSARFNYSHADRFATYTVRAQRPGSDHAYGAVVAAVEGNAADSEVSRYRPLLVLAEGLASPEDATVRAQFEAAFRRARSAELTIGLQGWRQYPRGPLWRPNLLVRARLPRWRFDSRMLVDQVTFRRDIQGGTTTELQLVRPDAYMPEPDVEEDADPFEGLVDWGDD